MRSSAAWEVLWCCGADRAWLRAGVQNMYVSNSFERDFGLPSPRCVQYVMLVLQPRRAGSVRCLKHSSMHDYCTNTILAPIVTYSSLRSKLY